MEHLRPGGLVAGWFCARCGLPSGMMGHGGQCEPNPALVAQLRQLNADPVRADLSVNDPLKVTDPPAFEQRCVSPKLNPQDRLIVDLGQLWPHRAAELMSRLVGELSVRFFKLGRHTLLSREGWMLAATIPAIGHLMMDLKVWDTPDTVRADVTAAFYLGARFVTVHHECVREARAAFIDHFGDVNLLQVPHRLLAVGNLTSAPTSANLVSTAIIATDGGVAPACDLKWLRRKYPYATLVTPGIRPVDETGDYIESNDHDRTYGIASPTEAIRAGADYLVVGRPIIQAPDPVAAARKIVEEIRGVIDERA